MSLGLPSLKRLLTLSLCTVLCTALMCTFTPSTHAWPKGGGGGNGGGGNGGGGDPPPPEPDLPEYTIEFIGAFGDDSNPPIKGMNDFGDLAGRFGLNLPSPHNQHAFVYIDGSFLDLNDLVDPESGIILRDATDINNYGQVAVIGWRDSDGDGVEDEWANFRITLDDGTGLPVFEELEPVYPAIGSNIIPGAMNDSGDIVGEVQTAAGDTGGAIWSSDNDGDGLVDLVDLGPSVSYRYAGGITNRRPDGTIQFTSVRKNGIANWRWTGDLMGNGILEDLGDFGIDGGADINDAGDVVGSIAFYEPGFRYTDDGGVDIIGQLVTKPKGGEFYGAAAAAINNFRETAGWAYKGKTAGVNEQTIFLHHDDFGTIDLSPQIVNLPNGLSGAAGLDTALYINDAGQIAGNSVDGAFILTPVAP